MFLNYLKDFIVKKTLKNSLKNVKDDFSSNAIQKVGLMVDASHFLETKQLIEALIVNGIAAENIKTIIYSDKFKKNEINTFRTFNFRDLKWNGQILNQEINSFTNEDFDLLISFYDVEKSILLQITHRSQAKFKVGFSSIDKRLNHFMIKTEINNHSIFVNELFKYLKLLNKI